MNFKSAVNNVNGRNINTTKTTNGMVALTGSADYCTDLFFKIGASRNRREEVLEDFINAYYQDAQLALRILAWARDIRGGAGERQVFKDIMRWLESNDPNSTLKMIPKIPELGRWDDLLVFDTPDAKNAAYTLIGAAMKAGDGLVGKWMPREKSSKGKIAKELQVFLGMTPKQYRKTLAELTRVVENQMCQGSWDSINFSQVPSVASARYKKAFGRHTSKYGEYIQALNRGDEGVKVNASAIFPHDVLKGVIGWYSNNYSQNELDHIKHQWDSLPNYVGDSNILPLVDVSGSMSCPVGGSGSLQCIEVAVSLGLYLADKNLGAFRDVFMSFSSNPVLVSLKGGNIIEKIHTMLKSHWNMSTDLEKAFKEILRVAVANDVPSDEMPKKVIIFSDMQFNRCITNSSHTAFSTITKEYRRKGYEVPQIIFWNLNAHNNTPVSFTQQGTALVSGFSPALLKSLLSDTLEDFTPRNIMLQTVMVDRYKVI